MRSIQALTAFLAAIVLCSCSAQDRDSSPFVSPSHTIFPHPSTTVSSDATAPSPVPAAEGAPTARGGDVVKKLGEAGQLITSKGEVLAEVSIMSVTLEHSCVAFDGSTYHPEGTLYKLGLSTHLANSPHTHEDNALNFIVVEADTFTLRDATGKVIQQTGRHASNACLDDTARIPPSILPGEAAQGFLYIEAPDGATTFTWNPWGVSGSGWEWKL